MVFWISNENEWWIYTEDEQCKPKGSNVYLAALESVDVSTMVHNMIVKQLTEPSQWFHDSTHSSLANGDKSPSYKICQTHT